MAGSVRAVNLLNSLVSSWFACLDGKARLEGLLPLISGVEGCLALQKVLRMRAWPGLCMLKDFPALLHISMRVYVFISILVRLSQKLVIDPSEIAARLTNKHNLQIILRSADRVVIELKF